MRSRFGHRLESITTGGAVTDEETMAFISDAFAHVMVRHVVLGHMDVGVTDI